MKKLALVALTLAVAALVPSRGEAHCRGSFVVRPYVRSYGYLPYRAAYDAPVFRPVYIAPRPLVVEPVVRFHPRHRWSRVRWFRHGW